MICGPDVVAFDDCLRQAVVIGEPVSSGELVGRTAIDPERDRIFTISASPLHDQSGQVFALCMTVDDVTEQCRTRERLALHNRASTHIGTTLDLMGTAQELAETAVPRLCDWITVDLLETVLNGEEPSAFTGSVALRRMANRSIIEGEPEAVCLSGEVDFYPPQSPAVRSMATGKSAVYRTPDPIIQSWLAVDPVRADRFRVYKFQSIMSVPICARGAVLGVTIFFRRTNDPFTEGDRLLAEELVALAAVCLDNARRFTRERAAALMLQRSLLPRRIPTQPAVEIASRYFPADSRTGAGGDWFDVIPLSGARVALVVGDVVGHGISAAASMGRLRTAVRTLADVDLSPDELLTHLDDLVSCLDAEDDTHVGTAELGATCTYGIYDPVSRRFSVARAGHPPPVIVAPDGTAEYLQLPEGPPLGVGGLPFESVEIELAEGSVIALYTDGLITSREREIDDGLEQLRSAISQTSLSPQALCDRIIENVLPEHSSDDVTLLIARTRAMKSNRVRVRDIPPDPAVVADARAWAAQQLAEWELHDKVDVTELVVSELVTNAIRYAHPPIELRLIRDRTLICEVSDASNTAPHMRRARISDEGGRGLLLVAQLTQRWGTRHTRSGKAIWCDQLLAGDS
jgi:serine phosphatase RsbU (regulator of sigma subunit)/anti-sigma regulatory factor (Ser/Thr protein kinase)